MRTVLMVLVVGLLTACGADPEIDGNGHVVRQCRPMQGLFMVRMQNVQGVSASCPVNAFETGIAFGTYAKPGEVTYSDDGCNAIVNVTFSGVAYSYDLQIEPDASSAHGSGTLTSGTCRATFAANVVSL